MGCVDGMIEGRFLIRMKRRRGRRIEKRSPCLLPSPMGGAASASMGLRLIKSSPLVGAGFQKILSKGRHQRRCTMVSMIATWIKRY